MNKRIKFWGITAVIIIFSVLLIVFVAGSSTPVFLKDGISDSDWIQGNKNAKVVLIEYSDFECPACKIFAQEIQSIVDEFSEHIVFTYRHYPLNIHEYAIQAAYAADAAGAQGKFWDMHDMLFLTQEEWASQKNPEESFFNYAKNLGLDMKKFEEDYNSKSVRGRVEASQSFAQELGLTGTPSLFINGKKINNPRSHESFRKLIRETISQNS